MAKNKWGRPQKYTPTKLMEKFNEYVQYCKENKKPVFKRWFAVYAGVYYDYLSEKAKDKKFSDTIKAIHEFCEAFSEEMLYTSKNITGVIFSLKNNYNWIDKQEVKSENETKLKIEDLEKLDEKDLLRLIK